MASPRSETGDVAPWRYVVPNAFTSLSLLIGVFAVFRASQGQFEDAGWLILWCVLLDKADGTAARLLGSTSEFGMQLDSLADLVTFGIAPAMTAFMFVWQDPHGMFRWWHGPVGNVALHAFVAIYILGACLRLAKFNVMTSSSDKKVGVFFGMPTTYAGGAISLTLLVALEHNMIFPLRQLPVLAMICGFAMVSNAILPKVQPRSTKFLQWFQIVNVSLAYVFGFARIFPEYLWLLMAGYGFFGFSWGFIHRAEFDPHPEPEPEPS